MERNVNFERDLLLIAGEITALSRSDAGRSYVRLASVDGRRTTGCYIDDENCFRLLALPGVEGELTIKRPDGTTHVHGHVRPQARLSIALATR